MTSEVIAEVRSRASILEVVSEFVVLKRAGKEYKGLCPFHTEKTPSFHVNTEKAIYKCFGCGEGGDAFAFLQKVKGLDFIETVRDLAHKYNVPLVETNEERKDYDRRSAILAFYEKASQYYCQLLKDPKEGLIAREYLHARGVSEEIIEKFKLGYATTAWDGLLRFLTTSIKAAPETIEAAGLIRRRPDGTSYYDLFRHRLMIPICDDQGRVIAFGGRTLGDDQVKYLNSPETPIYIKGQHLFGLNLAKEAIKEKDSVIVVEGYFDAITSYQYGFKNTVATLGTALTDQQAKLLVRYSDSKRVYLGFDADPAGVRATERGVETLNTIAEGVGIELRVITIPGGKDPDECLRSSGPLAFQKAVDEAQLLIDYHLAQAMQLVNTTTHTGRIEAARKIVPILAQIKNAVGRGEYIRQWSLKIGLREEELLADVGQFRRSQNFGLRNVGQNAPGGTTPFGSRMSPGSTKLVGPRSQTIKAGYIEAERQILALYLTSREDYAQAHEIFADEVLISPEHKRIKEAIHGIGTQFNTMDDLQCRLMDRLESDTQAKQALVEVILKVEELRKQKSSVETVLWDSRIRLLKERLDQETSGVRSLLASAKSETEQEELQSKIKQLTVHKVTLANASSLNELGELKRKIDEITGVAKAETAV